MYSDACFFIVIGGNDEEHASHCLTAAMNYLDDDGNLTSDGLWDYTWEAENQLTAMTMKLGLPTGMIRKRLEPDEFLQDFAGHQKTPCRTTGDRPLCAGGWMKP